MRRSQFDRIVEDVCLAVDNAVGKPFDHKGVFGGKTKCTSEQSIRRKLIFLLVHDYFGLSWRAIAKLSGMSVSSIRANVYAARSYIKYDALYMSTYNLMMEQFNSY